MDTDAHQEDWIAGTTFEAYTEVAEEPVVVAIEGLDLGTENYA